MKRARAELMPALMMMRMLVPGQRLTGARARESAGVSLHLSLSPSGSLDRPLGPRPFGAGVHGLPDDGARRDDRLSARAGGRAGRALPQHGVARCVRCFSRFSNVGGRVCASVCEDVQTVVYSKTWLRRSGLEENGVAAAPHLFVCGARRRRNRLSPEALSDGGAPDPHASLSRERHTNVHHQHGSTRHVLLCRCRHHGVRRRRPSGVPFSRQQCECDGNDKSRRARAPASGAVGETMSNRRWSHRHVRASGGGGGGE